MTDFARLQIQIDSAGVVTGTAKLKELEVGAGKTEKATKGLSATFAGIRDVMQGPIAAVNMAIGAFTQIAAKADRMIMQGAEMESAWSNLSSVLAATGGAAGMTMQSMMGLTDSLEKLTLFEDEAVTQAQAVMLTFRSIGKDVFPTAIKAAADMATVMKMDLQSAVMMLGKGLNEPIQGIGALRKAGVQLTDAQELQVKSFMKVNDIASAQKVILGELNLEFSGAAVNAANTATGSYMQLKKALGEVSENLGLLLGQMAAGTNGKGLTGWLFDMAGAIGAYADSIAGARTAKGGVTTIDAINKEIAGTVKTLEDLKASLNDKSLLGSMLGPNTIFGYISGSMASITSEIAKNQKTLDALYFRREGLLAEQKGVDPKNVDIQYELTPEQLASIKRRKDAEIDFNKFLKMAMNERRSIANQKNSGNDFYKDMVDEAMRMVRLREQMKIAIPEIEMDPYVGYVEGQKGKYGMGTRGKQNDPYGYMERAKGSPIDDKLWRDAAAAANQYDDILKGLKKSLTDLATGEVVGLFTQLGYSMAQGADGAKSMADYVAEMAREIMNKLPELLFYAGVQMLGVNATAGLALIAASGIVAIGAGAMNWANEQASTSVKANALGDVYGSRSLSAYSNGIYDSPQFFKFSRGGVFGEAGSEAIMPLARTASGQLGVHGQSAPIQVTIIDQSTGVKIETEETRNADGTKGLKLTIRDAVRSMLASGEMDPAMRRYGMTPATRRVQ
jgi:hypothetical protein